MRWIMSGSLRTAKRKLPDMVQRGSCVLVEAKVVTGNAKSAKTVLAHPEKYHVNLAIKLGDYNVGREGKILTLPMYMGFLLTEN